GPGRGPGRGGGALGARVGRPHPARRLRRRRAADSRQSTARQASRGARLVAPLFPLACAGQAAAVGRGAPALVWRGQAPAARQPASAARPNRRGDPAAEGSQGTRQDRRRPRRALAMEIRVTPHGPHVVVLTIDNQPRLNAMSRAMLGELGRLWDELERGPCRCIVLTGAGERAFTAGADMSGDLSASAETARVVNHALLKHDVYTKPIVAAVNGDCAGGGVELLLATDIRVAAPHARFGLPEVKWSVYPFGGATIKLVQQIGYVHAMELLLTAQLIDAAEAARLGLINRVVPAEQLMPGALAPGEGTAANSPAAGQAVRQQISATMAEHARARDPLEQERGDRVRASANFPEGVAAFREKRQPRYD